jgi:hypothetical protein
VAQLLDIGGIVDAVFEIRAELITPVGRRLPALVLPGTGWAVP